jgi:PEP-CTERM motif
MKTLTIPSQKMLGGLFLAMALGFSTNAVGQILYIDDSNPAAVRIYSSGGDATASNSTTVAEDGADLLGFFPTSAAGGGNYMGASGNLTAPGDLAYNEEHPDDQSVGTTNIQSISGSFLDLTLFLTASDGDTTPQNFTTGSPAFTGTMTMDLSAYAGDLPTPGSTGTVIAGWSGGEIGGAIGEWEVVPEPSTYAMVLAGLGLLVFWRRRTYLA